MSENRQGIDLSKLTAAQLRFVLAENKVSFPSKAKKADLLRLCNKLIDESDAEEVSQRIGAAIAKERVDHETKLRLRQKKMKESAKANSEPAESLPAEKVSVQKSPNKKSVAGKSTPEQNLKMRTATRIRKREPNLQMITSRSRTIKRQLSIVLQHSQLQLKQLNQVLYRETNWRVNQTFLLLGGLCMMKSKKNHQLRKVKRNCRRLKI